MFKKEFAKVATLNGFSRVELKKNEDGKYSIEVAIKEMTRKYQLTEKQWKFFMDTEKVQERTGEKTHYNYQKTVYFDADNKSVPKSQSVRTLTCYFYKKFATKKAAEKEYKFLLTKLVKTEEPKAEPKAEEVKKPNFKKMTKAELLKYIEANC